MNSSTAYCRWCGNRKQDHSESWSRCQMGFSPRSSATYWLDKVKEAIGPSRTPEQAKAHKAEVKADDAIRATVERQYLNEWSRRKYAESEGK